MSGGMRAVQTIKPILTALKMAPIVEAVAIPFVNKLIDSSGRLAGDASLDKSAAAMLDELSKWDRALSTLRA